MKQLFTILFCVVLTACGGGGGGSASPTTSPSAAITAITISNSNTVYNSATGDLNGDGLDDVVVSGWNYDSTTAYVWVLVQNEDGTLTDKTSVLLPTNTITGSQHVFIADFDNDGKNDIFLPGFLDGSVMAPTTSVMFWNNGSQFSRQIFNEQVMAHGSCIDDINGDGKMDILAAGDMGASILYVNNGNRSFTADAVTLNNNWFASCGVIHQSNGDINILMGNNHNLAGYTSAIAVYDSNLLFQNYIGVNLNPNDGIINSAVFDANGDGHKDFVMALSNIFPASPSRRVLLNTGTNSYIDGQQLDSFGSEYYSLVTTLLDGTPAVFLPETGTGSRLYYHSNGVMVTYKPTSFGNMSGSNTLLMPTIYKNIRQGKIYMLQLLNDGNNSTFKTREM
jgi:FG-GAP-like repeat